MPVGGGHVGLGQNEPVAAPLIDMSSLLQSRIKCGTKERGKNDAPAGILPPPRINGAQRRSFLRIPHHITGSLKAKACDATTPVACRFGVSRGVVSVAQCGKTALV